MKEPCACVVRYDPFRKCTLNAGNLNGTSNGPDGTIALSGLGFWDEGYGAGLADWTLFKRSRPEPAPTDIFLPNNLHRYTTVRAGPNQEFQYGITQPDPPRARTMEMI